LLDYSDVIRLHLVCIIFRYSADVLVRLAAIRLVVTDFTAVTLMGDMDS